MAKIVATFAVAVAFAASFGSPAWALSPAVERQWTCPYDGTTFNSYPLGVPRKIENGLDRDPYFMAAPPWAIASCPTPTNGFVFYKYQFGDDEFERLRPLVLSDAFRALRDDSAQFRMALILDRAGAPLESVSSALLIATRDAKDPAAYKRYADALLKQFPALLAGGRNPDELADLRTLQIELLRRSGRFDEAQAAARGTLSAVEAGTLPYLIAALQLDLIERRFDGTGRVPDHVRSRARLSTYSLTQRVPIGEPGKTRLDNLEGLFDGRSPRWVRDGLSLVSGQSAVVHRFDSDDGVTRHADPPGGAGPAPSARETTRPQAFPVTAAKLLADDHGRQLFFVPARDAGSRLVFWDHVQARELWSVPLDRRSLHARARPFSSTALDERRYRDWERRRFPGYAFGVIPPVPPENWSGAISADGTRILVTEFSGATAILASLNARDGSFQSIR